MALGATGYDTGTTAAARVCKASSDASEDPLSVDVVYRTSSDAVRLKAASAGRLRVVLEGIVG